VGDRHVLVEAAKVGSAARQKQKGGDRDSSAWRSMRLRLPDGMDRHHLTLIVPWVETEPLFDDVWVALIGLLTVELVATTELLTIVCEPMELIVRLPPDPLLTSTPLLAPFTWEAMAPFRLCACEDSRAPVTAAPDDVVPH
jgi:hypothetical protein